MARDSRLFLLQSAQVLFPSSFNKLLIVCVFCAARSAAGFGALRDMIYYRSGIGWTGIVINATLGVELGFCKVYLHKAGVDSTSAWLWNGNWRIQAPVDFMICRDLLA